MSAALAFLEQYQQAQESLKGLVKSPMQVVRWWEGNMEQGLLKTNAGYDEDCSKYTTGYIVLDDSSNLTAAGLLLDFPSGFDTWSGAQRSQSGDWIYTTVGYYSPSIAYRFYGGRAGAFVCMTVSWPWGYGYGQNLEAIVGYIGMTCCIQDGPPVTSDCECLLSSLCLDWTRNSYMSASIGGPW